MEAEQPRGPVSWECPCPPYVGWAQTHASKGLGHTVMTVCTLKSLICGLSFPPNTSSVPLPGEPMGTTDSRLALLMASTQSMQGDQSLEPQVSSVQREFGDILCFCSLPGEPQFQCMARGYLAGDVGTRARAQTHSSGLSLNSQAHTTRPVSAPGGLSSISLSASEAPTEE